MMIAEKVANVICYRPSLRQLIRQNFEKELT
jgi:hypothetical protein